MDMTRSHSAMLGLGLREWLVNHTLKTDKKLASFLLEQNEPQRRPPLTRPEIRSIAPATAGGDFEFWG